MKGTQAVGARDVRLSQGADLDATSGHNVTRTVW
jgi:hypothetical protein